jgi:hypothetical protein
MLRHHIADAVVLLLPGPAAVEAVIMTVAVQHRRALDRVPVVDAAVHWPVLAEHVPVLVRAHHDLGLAGQGRHVEQAVDHDAGADPFVMRGLEEVDAVEQPPLALGVAEGVGVDRERLVRHQHLASVEEGSGGMLGHRNPQLLVGALGRVAG